MLEQYPLQITYVPASPQPSNIVPVADTSKKINICRIISYIILP